MAITDDTGLAIAITVAELTELTIQELMELAIAIAELTEPRIAILKLTELTITIAKLGILIPPSHPRLATSLAITRDKIIRRCDYE